MRLGYAIVLLCQHWRPRDTLPSLRPTSPLSPWQYCNLFPVFQFKPWQTGHVSPESVFRLRHSQLNLFVLHPQLSLSTASLLEIDNDISLFQNRLLTLPRPHPWRSICLLTLAMIRLARYKFSKREWRPRQVNFPIYRSYTPAS